MPNRYDDVYSGAAPAPAVPAYGPRPSRPATGNRYDDVFSATGPASTAPSIGERAIEAAHYLTYPLTLPKRGIDVLARTGARAMGIPVSDETTAGSMLRAGLG